VNADGFGLEATLVPEVDTDVNAARVKGIGALGNVATPAAVSSAVCHATVRRVRQLPIRLEDLL
jgi:xanthine dehydrogenase YagR molybdenum-binding subunit